MRAPLQPEHTARRRGYYRELLLPQPIPHSAVVCSLGNSSSCYTIMTNRRYGLTAIAAARECLMASRAGTWRHTAARRSSSHLPHVGSKLIATQYSKKSRVGSDPYLKMYFHAGCFICILLNAYSYIERAANLAAQGGNCGRSRTANLAGQGRPSSAYPRSLPLRSTRRSSL